MIIIDGKKEELAPSFIAALKDEIGDGRYLQTPKELITRVLTNKEGKTLLVSPSRAPIPLNDTFYGTVERDSEDRITGFNLSDTREAVHHKVFYCEKADQKLGGGFEKHFPDYLVVGGTGKPHTHIIQQEQFELYLFVNTFSRFVSTSKNAKANSKKEYYLELANPELDATVDRVNSLFETEARYLINFDSTKGGFTVEELENIGRHLGFDIKRYRNTDTLRKAILTAAATDESARSLSGNPKVYGYEYIIQLGQKKGPDQDVRELILTAQEQGILEHDTSRKHWVIKKDGHVVSNFCPVDDHAPIKINALIAFLKLDREAKEKLEGLVAPKEKKSKKAEA